MRFISFLLLLAAALRAQDTCALKPLSYFARPKPLTARASEYQVFSPSQIAVAEDGFIYVSERNAHRILEIAPDGALRSVASGLRYPEFLVVARDKSIYFIEENQRLMRLSPSGEISRIAPATRFIHLAHLALNANGDLFISDSLGFSVYRLDTKGELSLFAKLRYPPMSSAPLPSNRLLVKHDLMGFFLIAADGSITEPPQLQPFSRANLMSGPNESALLADLTRSSIHQYSPGASPMPITAYPAGVGNRSQLARSRNGDFFTFTGSWELIQFNASGSTRLTAAIVREYTETGPIQQVFVFGPTFVPHPGGRIHYLALNKLYELQGTTVLKRTVGADINIHSATFSPDGLLFVLTTDREVWRVEPDGSLVPPYPGKPWTNFFSSLNPTNDSLVAAEGYLYVLAQGFVFTYSLQDGSTASYQSLHGQLARTLEGKAVGFRSGLWADELGPKTFNQEKVAFLPQDASTRSQRIGSGIYLAGEHIFRRNDDGRWFRLRVTAQDALVPPYFTQLAKWDAGNHLVLFDFAYRMLWLLESPESCALQPLPYFPSAGRIVQAASYSDADTVSPMSLVTIFAESMDAGGTFGTPEYPTFRVANFDSLGGSTFTPFSAHPNQASFVTGATLTSEELFVVSGSIRYRYPGKLRNAATTPGLFVQGALKDGAAASLNENASLNSAENPAASGSIVVLFGSGFGDPQTAKDLSVRIAGQPAEILYSGQAPGLITGLWQINVRLPQGLPSGLQPIEINAAGQLLTQRQAVGVHVK